jgi:hypothetical protein
MNAPAILAQINAARAEVASAALTDATLADWRQIAAAAAALSAAIEDRREHRRRYQLGVASLPPLARVAAALLLVLGAAGCSPSGHDAPEAVVSPACRVEVEIDGRIETVTLAEGQSETLNISGVDVTLRVVPAYAPEPDPLEEMQ